MTTREVLIDLNGRVNPNFKKNLRDTEAGLRGVQIAARGAKGRFEDAGQSVEGFAEDMKTLTRLQTSGRNSINRYSRQLRVLNAQYEGAKKGSDEYNRLGKRIESVNRQMTLQRGILGDVEERLERVAKAERRAERAAKGVAARARAYRAVGYAALGAAAAIGGAFAQSVRTTNRAVEERAALLRTNANLTILEAENLRILEGRYKVQANSIATGLRTLQKEIGEFSAGTDIMTAGYLTKLDIDLAAIGDTAGGVGYQFAEALKQLSGLEDETRQAAAANYLFTRGGQEAVKLLRSIGAESLTTAEIYDELFENTDLTEKFLQGLHDQEGAWGEVSIAAGDLQQVLVGRYAPAIEGAGVATEGLIRRTEKWLRETESAPALIAAAAGGLLAVGGVATGAAGKVAEFGQQTFFAVQGLAAMKTASLAALGVGKSLVGAIPKIASAMKGFALATWGAVKAAIAFAFTPVGAVIVGIAAGVAALAAGIVYLADKFGGFGRLWDITLAGAKAAFLSWAQGVTLGLRPIAAALDALIMGINAVSAGLSKIPGVDLGTIDFRAGSAFAALDDAAGSARADFQRQAREGLAEGRRQQAAGTSVGQRIGGTFGFGGGQAPGPATAPLAQAPQAAPTPASAARRAPQAAESANTNNYITAEIHVSIANADDWERAGELVRENLLQRPFAAAGR